MDEKNTCNCKICTCKEQSDGLHCFESCPPAGGVCIFCDISTLDECCREVKKNINENVESSKRY